MFISKANMRFILILLTGFFLNVASSAKNLRGQQNEIELMQEIRDKVMSLNEKIDYLNDEFETEDENEIPEENLEERIEKVRDRIQYLKGGIANANADDYVKEEDIEEPEVQDEVEIDSVYDLIQKIKDRIDTLDDAMEEEGNFEEDEYASSSIDEFSSVDHTDETGERMNALKDRIIGLKAEIENEIMLADEEDENSGSVPNEMEDQLDDEEDAIFDRINAIRDRIESLKSMINKGSENEEENFETDEYDPPYASDRIKNIREKINYLIEKVENDVAEGALDEQINSLTGKIEHDIAEEAVDEGSGYYSDSEEFFSDSLSTDSEEEFGDVTEEKLNEIRDRIQMLKNKLMHETLTDEMEEGNFEDKNDEFKDYEFEKKIDLLKEDLKNTMKKNDLNGEDDFS